MLDTISAICSIFGFIISIATFGYAFLIEKKVRSFEKNVLFNTRVPILTSNLKLLNSQLSKDLRDKNERSIKETINLCKTVIEDINPKLSGDLNKQGIKIRKLLKKQYKSLFQLENEEIPKWKFWIRITTIDNLWESYDNLNSLITRIDNLKKDKKIIQ